MLKITQLWISFTNSLWFLPSLVIASSAGLAIGMIEIDNRLAPDDLREIWFMLEAGADGARDLLSAIASSMMAVVSVTFSITILVLSQAAAQYSPRTLRNFMKSRSSQLCLGAFVGTFVYSIIVLRSIDSDPETRHVPSIAVFFALILAIISVLALVYFIHHIASSIQASTLISAIAKETLGIIDKTYRNQEKVTKEEYKPSETEGFAILSESSGYIQDIDTKVLSKIAAGKNYTFIVTKERGDYVVKQSTLVRAHRRKGQPDKELTASIQDAFAIGRNRTIEQDPAFGIRQLVDIALKALSPSLNDTTNAVMCLHHLGAIMSKLVTLKLTQECYYDEEGNLLVFLKRTSFADHLALAFDQIRLNSKGNLGVSATAVKVLKTIKSFTLDEQKIDLLDLHIKLWTEQARNCVEEPYDISRLDAFLKKQRD